MSERGNARGNEEEKKTYQNPSPLLLVAESVGGPEKDRFGFPSELVDLT